MQPSQVRHWQSLPFIEFNPGDLTQPTPPPDALEELPFNDFIVCMPSFTHEGVMVWLRVNADPRRQSVTVYGLNASTGKALAPIWVDNGDTGAPIVMPESFDHVGRWAWQRVDALTKCLRQNHLVRSSPVLSPRELKRAQRKRLPSWLRPLPSLVLMRSSPSSHSTDAGTHRSPRPHRRRGHWRRLAGDDRQTFVRPAWVGPEAWVIEGRSYQVIL